jgi:RNA polymerase sigma-70 factor, ECF subfamily
MAPQAEELDGRLAQRIASNADAPAEAELCRRLWPRVRALGLRRLRNEPDAVDLAQQVLMVVIEALRAGQVSEPERIGAFVMGTCRNILLDRHKVDRRRGVLFAQFAAEQPVAYHPVAPVDHRQLLACLELLSARERAIVVSTYVDEQDGAQIAAGLGMEPGTVRVKRHRALKQLLDCLGGAA